MNPSSKKPETHPVLNSSFLFFENERTKQPLSVCNNNNNKEKNIDLPELNNVPPSEFVATKKISLPPIFFLKKKLLSLPSSVRPSIHPSNHRLGRLSSS